METWTRTWLITLVILFLVDVSTETVTSFTTNFDSAVCTDTEVFINCTTNNNLLIWASGGNDITFNTNSNLGQVPESDNDLEFTITLLSINGSILSSTASVVVTQGFTNGTSIECRDAIAGSVDSESTTIYVASVPGSPTNFRNTSSTYSSVTLSWSMPSFSTSPVTGYNIDITQPAGVSCPASQCSSLSPSTFTTTIDNLTFNTEYTFTISAASCSGNGSKTSVEVYLLGEAPDPPVSTDVCVNLVNKGKDLNLRVQWECPSIDEDRVPPILNYLVNTESQSSLANPINDISVPVDCRCGYSTDVPIEDTPNVLYSVAVHSNNTVGSNSQEVSIYSSANISTSIAQRSVSSALIAVSISWGACAGISADIVLSYHPVGNELTAVSVTTRVTLPIERVFVALTNLNPGTEYGYVVSLDSDGGITLGVSEEGTFATTVDGDVITVTVCTTATTTSNRIMGSDTTTTVFINQPSPTETRGSITGMIDDCPDAMNSTGLLSGIGVLAAMVVVMIVLLIMVLCLCIVSLNRKKGYSLAGSNHLGDLQSRPSSEGYSLTALQNKNQPQFSTDLNMSYGHVYTGMDDSSNNEKVATYEEIKATKVNTTNGSSYATSPVRPPYPVPYAEPVRSSNMQLDTAYAVPDEEGRGRVPNTTNTTDIINPSYGQTKETPNQQEYLTVQS